LSDSSISGGPSWAKPRACAPISIACALGYLDFRFAAEPWRDACPKLAAWFAEVSKLAPLAETVPVG
jgi:glutathione S-transferase